MSKDNKLDIDNTGERMVPEFSGRSLMYAEHVTRYQAALPIVKSKKVLDIASGSGYGTKILSESASEVVGVDYDESAIKYASSKFKSKNIKYIQGDATDIPLSDNAVDVVVSFETIEHIQDYKKFIQEIDRVLKDDGVLILSTPNDLEFAEGNHFHLHEFEYKELVDLVKETFPNIDSYFQATWKYVAIGDEKFIRNESAQDIYTTNFSPVELEKCLYFYLVCSKKPITAKVQKIAGIGEHYSDRDIQNAWRDSSAHHTRLQSESQSEIDKLKNELHKTKQTLEIITNSKSYRAARKFSHAKSKLKGGN